MYLFVYEFMFIQRSSEFYPSCFSFSLETKVLDQLPISHFD
jgi:hypothetical protein